MNVNKLTVDGMRPAALGKHLIADFYDASHLLDCSPATDILRQAALAAKATVLEVNMHDFGERYGFTGVAVLAESHISIHTWPENDYAAIDIFMCGNAEPLKSLEILRQYFKPGREQVDILQRGTMPQVATSA